MLLFSVIIPARNEEKWIGKTLASLERQTLDDFEIIVVLDKAGSDKTYIATSKFACNSIFQENSGVHNARDFGAKQAKNPFLVFTDADTILPPDFLAKVAETLDGNESIIALTGLTIPYDGPIILKVQYALWSLVKWFLSLIGKFYPPGHFLVVRKDLFFKAGGYGGQEHPYLPKSLLDGRIGSSLSKLGKTKFSFEIRAFPSARRMLKLGYLKFNMSYAYILGDFIPSLQLKFLAEVRKRLEKELHDKGEFSSLS